MCLKKQLSPLLYLLYRHLPSRLHFTVSLFREPDAKMLKAENLLLNSTCKYGDYEIFLQLHL